MGPRVRVTSSGGARRARNLLLCREYAARDLGEQATAAPLRAGEDGVAHRAHHHQQRAPAAERARLERAAVGAGLKLALLKGVDPNPANFVASAWLAAKGVSPQADGASLLARLEVNAQAAMVRVSVRSASDALNGAVAKSIATQLGTPV